MSNSALAIATLSPLLLAIFCFMAEAATTVTQIKKKSTKEKLAVIHSEVVCLFLLFITRFVFPLLSVGIIV